jgi:hypothetical protein
MTRELNRRAFVAGSAGLVGLLAGPQAAGADDEIRIADPSAQGIAERVGAVGQGLEQVGARLDRIDAVLINPPEPDKLPIREALVRVKTAAEGIVVTADDMLRRV